MKRQLLTILGILCSSMAWCADGDTFIANTLEGVEMTFKVISEENKTCQVGTGYVNSPAIISTYSDEVTIPSEVNGYDVTAISKSAFRGCKLASIFIPESILMIDNYAFNECYQLSSVTLSEGIETIGNNAFAHCMKLESLYIPSSLSSIGQFAFANCRGIKSITVSENNSVFDSHNNCNAIIKTSSKELVLGCKNTIIPRDVRSIGNNAFYDCYYLTKIVIPDYVYSIGADAFSGCHNLKTINIPDNLSYIGNYAFYCCSSLTSITLPPNVSLGKYAFRDTGLTKVFVGATQPKSLDGEEFNKTSQMTLYVPAGSKSKYESASYWGNFKEIIELTDDTYIPYGDMTIKIIDESDKKCEVYSAASQPSYTIVPSSVLGYKVIGIDKEAFEGEDGIETIDIPSSIEYIKTGAFKKTDIYEVVISDIEAWCKIVFDNSTSNPLSYANLYLRYTWSVNGQLVEDLYIPHEISKINDYAFYGCSSLSSVYFPKEIKSIGNNAFWGCEKLVSVTINTPNPPEIFSYSFYNKRATLYVPYGSIDTYVNAGYSNYFKDIKSIPLNIGDTFVEKTIEGAEIKFCVISNDDKTCSVGKGYVGYNDDTPEPYCISPEYEGDVTIPALANGYRVVSIKDQAFSSANGMKVRSINIPDGITTIGRKAFEGCKELTSINLPNSITRINDYAFAECENLGSVILPDNIITIPICMFQGCSNLYSITIPNSVQEIGWNAFQGCSNLSSFTIPESVWLLGINAFSGTAWLNNHPDGLVYKDNILFGYKGNQPKGLLEIAKGTRVIGTSAFENCKEITSVIFPQSVKHITLDAFYGCSGITFIELPYFINSILSKSFSGCSSLTYIAFPKSISRIDSYAFAGCDNISKIFIERTTPLDISNKVFSNKNATLYVPDGCKLLYEDTEGWQDFKDIVEQKVEVTEIDEISIENVEINKGSSVEAIIKIYDENLINAFEFDLVLPKYITIAEDEYGDFLISKGSLLKNSGWRVLVTKLEDNTFHFKCFTTVKGDIIFSSRGELLLLSLKTTDDMQEGVFNAEIRNILLKVSDEKLLKAKDYSFVVELSNYIKGDVNGDETIDVTDIVSIVNYIVGNPYDSFKNRAADLNDDGEVDIFDVMKLINLVMKQKASARNNTRAAEELEEQAIISNTGEGLMLGVNSPERFTAFQFDVEVADGAELLDARLTTNAGGHKLYSIKISENTFRVIGISINNTILTANGNYLVELKFSRGGDIQINNITFVTPQETKVRFAGNNTNVTGIGNIAIDQHEEIFDLSGRKIDTNRSQLPKGVYIINNKKVVIK